MRLILLTTSQGTIFVSFPHTEKCCIDTNNNDNNNNAVTKKNITGTRTHMTYFNEDSRPVSFLFLIS